MPILSVIIPVFNSAAFLPKCIDSVMGQSFTDFELLLIDDGSSDGSGIICDNYSKIDNRIRVFHKENGGASSARNLGLKNARGHWITFIDSDDYVNNDYFLLPYDNEIDLYAQNWRFETGETKENLPPQVIGPELYPLFMQNYLHTDFFRTACGFFFKYSIIRKNSIMFESRFKLGEDTLFALDYFRYAASIHIMDNSCYIYNRQENWEKKYTLSWKEVQDYFNAFWQRYDALQIYSPKLVSFVFAFFRSKISSDEPLLSIKWALSEPVLKFKESRLSQKGVFGRIKYHILKAIAHIVHV
jgi:glycosyltransferase involved in cell wall biosynthesis